MKLYTSAHVTFSATLSLVYSNSKVFCIIFSNTKRFLDNDGTPLSVTAMISVGAEAFG